LVSQKKNMVLPDHFGIGKTHPPMTIGHNRPMPGSSSAINPLQQQAVLQL